MKHVHIKNNNLIEAVRDKNTRHSSNAIELDGSLAENVIGVLTNPSTSVGNMFVGKSKVISEKVKNEKDIAMLSQTPQAYFSRKNITDICNAISNSDLPKNGYYIGKIYTIVQPIGIGTRDSKIKRFPSRIILCFFIDENGESFRKFDIVIYTPNRYELYPYLLKSEYGNWEDRSYIDSIVYSDKNGNKITNTLDASHRFMEWAQRETDFNPIFSRIYISIGLLPKDQQKSTEASAADLDTSIESISDLKTSLKSYVEKGIFKSNDDDTEVNDLLFNPDTSEEKDKYEKSVEIETNNEIYNKALSIITKIINSNISVYNRAPDTKKEKPSKPLTNNEFNTTFDRMSDGYDSKYFNNKKIDIYNLYIRNRLNKFLTTYSNEVKDASESVVKDMISDIGVNTNKKLDSTSFVKKFKIQYKKSHNALCFGTECPYDYIDSLFNTDGGLYTYYTKLLDKDIVRENLNRLVNDIFEKLTIIKEQNNHGKEPTMLHLNENMSIDEMAHVKNTLKDNKNVNLSNKFVVRKNEQGHFVFLKFGGLAIRNYKNATLYDSKEDAEKVAADAGKGWEVVPAEDALRECIGNKYLRHGTIFESKNDYVQFANHLKKKMNTFESLSDDELSETYSLYKDSDNFFDKLICERLVEVARSRCSEDIYDDNEFDYDSTDEYNSDTDEQEIIHINSPLSDLEKEPVMEIVDDDGNSNVLYIDFEPGTPENPNGKLVAGSLIGGQVSHQFEMEYNWDIGLDLNLQNLDEIIEQEYSN